MIAGCVYAIKPASAQTPLPLVDPCVPSASGFEICAPVITPVQPCSFECAFCVCGLPIQSNHARIRTYISTQFRLHRLWMINTYFFENILYAMAQMTNQMTAVSMQQVEIIGKFFDAKHQMETQRLFQTLMAQAHKDYQPSEGMCDIGTTVRGLVTAERKSNLVQQTLSNRVMQRQLRSGSNMSALNDEDLYGRINAFKVNFCNKKDNANGLYNICAGATAPQATINKDVDYTRTVETKLTLDVDYSVQGLGAPTEDEISTFALMTNLFAHDVLPIASRRDLADENGNPRLAAFQYLANRAVAAKRSVAQNSIDAIIAERAAGDTATEYAPYVKSVLSELGVPATEIDFILGENPSYFAQMEVLTKKLYQNPVFYTELYDKPTNVLRKRAAIRATNLMQDRDFYKSLLRSEAVLSVALELMLNEEHKRVYAHLNRLRPDEESGSE